MYQSPIIFWLSIFIIFQSILVNLYENRHGCFSIHQFNYKFWIYPIFKLLTIIAKLFMSSDTGKDKENVSILARAYDCKIKNKIVVEQFLQIVRADHKLEKISQKGLLLIYFSEILLKAHIATGLKIRNFTSEFDKKEEKKRQRREGGGGGTTRRRKRKPNKQNERGTGKTLQQLSNESLSNPSNIERPRANNQNPAQSANQKEILENRQKSQQKNEESNASKQSKEQLKIQLNKITEQIRGQQDTYFPQIDIVPGPTFQDNSQSSSSQITGQISNLSEKVKIFTDIKDREKRGATTRRKGQNNSLLKDTRTKKKKFGIIDHSTLIQQTKVSENDITLNYTQISRFDTQQVVEFDLVQNFMEKINITKNEESIFLFEKSKIDAVRNMFQEISPPNADDFALNQVQNIQPLDIQFPDYTMSQPTSVPLFQPDFFVESLQVKDSQFNFDDLIKKSSKQKSKLFYQILWRQQNDQISIFQSNPQTFSVIKIKHT